MKTNATAISVANANTVCMNLVNRKVKSDFLILEGTCITCKNKIVRLVKPEE